MNIPHNYKPFFGLLFLLTAIALLNIPLLTTLWRYSFDDGTYSHAYLIPFITFYLYFKLSDIGLLNYRDTFSWLPIIPLILTGYAYFVFTNAQISVGYWFSFILFAAASVNTLFRFNFYSLFPVFFLAFLFPFWGILTEYLQTISVISVTFIMSLTAIPTYVEAQFITIPAGVFEIADGCSGLRYIIVSFAISSLFIFLYINNVKNAILFLTFAILGALLTNWIRISALIVIGEYTNMQSSLMEDHNTFGWYLYIPFMFLLFLWGNKLTTHDLLTTKPVEPIKNSSAYLPTVGCLLLCLIVFSTSLKTFLPNNTQAQTPQLNITTTSKTELPEIFSPTSVFTAPHTSKKDVNIVTYYFNGNDLDAKPTYFDNKFLPKGWVTKENYISNNWNVNVATSPTNNALIIYQYEINGEKIASSSKFKLARLLKGTSGIKETKLNWSIIKCSNDCKSELKTINE